MTVRLSVHSGWVRLLSLVAAYLVAVAIALSVDLDVGVHHEIVLVGTG